MGLHSGIAEYNSLWPEGTGYTKCVNGYASGYTWQTNEVSHTGDTIYTIVSPVTCPVAHFMCMGDTSVQGLHNRLHSPSQGVTQLKVGKLVFLKGKNRGKMCYRTPTYAQVRNVEKGI